MLFSKKLNQLFLVTIFTALPLLSSTQNINFEDLDKKTQQEVTINFVRVAPIDLDRLAFYVENLGLILADKNEYLLKLFNANHTLEKMSQDKDFVMTRLNIDKQEFNELINFLKNLEVEYPDASFVKQFIFWVYTNIYFYFVSEELIANILEDNDINIRDILPIEEVRSLLQAKEFDRKLQGRN